MKRPLFIALDFEKEKRHAFLQQFSGSKLDVKIGMELFYQEGPQVIEELKEGGHRIFLDLKLHDIPNTVKRAMRVLAGMEVDIVNVHAAGGRRMMEAAREGLEAGAKGNRPYLIAVTQLTSTDQRMLTDELLINDTVAEVVASYSMQAKACGLDGVVCSAKEVPRIQESCGEHFLTVTPGIRQRGESNSDQKRVVTPEAARQLGSWGIVVGRSITASPDPLATYRAMKEQWEGL